MIYPVSYCESVMQNSFVVNKVVHITYSYNLLISIVFMCLMVGLLLYIRKVADNI